MWHARLGHIGQHRMNRLAKEGLLGNIEKVDLPICEHWLVGKMTRKNLEKGKRAEFPLHLIHFYVCGSMNVRGRHVTVYFNTFIDDYT